MEGIYHEIREVKKGEPGYPDRMDRLPSMPDKLYYIGNLPSDEKPSIAVVGARSCSAYGRLQAFRYAKEMSAHGVQVISGLALGIDAEGHKGALEGTAPTFAVMGGGVDLCYPSSHRNLYERILWNGGGILSEYEPGTRALPYHFPERNRLISALSDVILVVEAREKSGSLITAGFALEQGKTIYAVPGAVTEELSRGCNHLIYDGAGIAYCPEVLLMEWGLAASKKTNNEQKMNFTLASDLKLLYSYVDSRPVNLESLVRRTGMPAAKVSASMVELMLMGLVEEAGRNYYIKR